MTIRYSLAPLLELTGWSIQRTRDIAPCGGEEYRRRLDEGVTEAIADRLATAASLHPHLVWPEIEHEGTRVCEATSCTQRFHPVRRAQKWCSPACRKREQTKRYQRKRWATDPAFVARQAERRRTYYSEVADYERAAARRYYAAHRDEVRARQNDRRKREDTAA